MLWIAQRTDNHRILGIYRNEEKAFSDWGDRDNVYIYWIESEV